jgi:isoleucyl-tRNA synthetase
MEDGTGIVHVAPSFGEVDFQAGESDGLDFVRDYVDLQGMIQGTYPFAGKLNLFRVYSGTVSADSTLYNSKKDTKERIGQIFLLEGKKQKPVGLQV